MHNSIDNWPVGRPNIQIRDQVHELQVGRVLSGGIYKESSSR